MRHLGITKDFTDEFFENPTLSFASQNKLHELFDQILDSDQEFVLIIGAGVALDGGFPSWSGLIKNIIDTSFIDDKWRSTAHADRADLLRKAETVIQIAVDYTSSPREEIIRNALYRSSDKSYVANVIPGNLADAIARLYFLMRKRIGIVTSNYDTVIETAINTYVATDQEQVVSPVPFDKAVHMNDQGVSDNWKCDSEVLHIHGILEPNTPPAGRSILTESDYLEYGSDIVDFIEALIQKKNVIFIGVSLTDPNLVAPLWRIKKRRAIRALTEAEPQAGSIPTGIYAFSVVSPVQGDGEDRSDIDKAESYEVRKALSLSNVLGISIILLKSYGEQMQLIDEMSYALQNAVNSPGGVEYIGDAGPDESIQYVVRLSRTLDECYRNLGCGDTGEFPVNAAAAELSDRLYRYLTPKVDDSIVDLLKTAKDKIRRSHAKSQRDVFADFAGSFDNERFGIFLWLRIWYLFMAAESVGLGFATDWSIGFPAP
jgi:SIR2-like domain